MSMRKAGDSLLVAGVAISLFLPATAQPAAKKRLLFLTQCAFYKHDSLPAAERAVVELGKEGGFDATVLEGYKQDADKLDLSFISAQYLAQFDGLMMMTNGELPLDDSQKRALIDFVREGKGFVAVHNAPVTLYTYPPFGQMLGGYFWKTFNGLARDPRTIFLKVEDRQHPATRMLPERWEVAHEEFYQFGKAPWDPSRPEDNVGAGGQHIPIGFSRDKVHVLLSIDTERTDMTNRPPEWQRGGDYPQAWYQDFGKGRSLYTSLGHSADTWSSNPLFRAHILGALGWAMRIEN